MNCRYCRTEIADTALICFRCGRATTDPAPSRRLDGTRRRAGWASVAAAILLCVAALYMGRATAGQVPRWMSWTIAALAAIVLAWRVWRRRRT